jgi:membrane-associated protease RseP (regulator of RpoE activity)
MNRLHSDAAEGHQEDHTNRQKPGRFHLRRWFRSDNPKLNYWLFVATCLSTFLTGWLYNGYWQAGAWYSGGIITILLAHEMGHYLMCRKYAIRATLPFFIPMPLTLFGTLGAVIRMEAYLPSRKALFDVAVAGPLAGLFFTIPAIYFGVQMSQIIDLAGAASGGGVQLAEPFLFSQIAEFAIGPIAAGKTILIHPLGYAGWTGLFVTALNLLPIGQLDGGHVVYAVFGKRHKFIAGIALGIFALVTIFWFHGWALLLLLLVLFGFRHPPTLDDAPLDHKRIALGLMTLVIFALSFSPEPIMFVE